MKASTKIVIGGLSIACAVLLAKLLIGDSLVALFSPRGAIAAQEKDVILKSVLIMLGGAIPTFIVVLAFAWKYRADNAKAKYEPERQGSAWRQLGLWALPAIMIAVLWVITWESTHKLDPAKQVGEGEPLVIQVIALQWKWLFIYPEQGIASVNLVEMPVGRPIHFDLTADAPVSSFWIPQLGSQIYAMAAMKTQLNLIADVPGEFPGKNMEINGDGYAHMNFTAKAVSDAEFEAWVLDVRRSRRALDDGGYALLAAPSQDDPPTFYATVKPGMFEQIVMKPMMPPSDGAEAPEGARGAAPQGMHDME